jgi:hypothetical protein
LESIDFFRDGALAAQFDTCAIGCNSPDTREANTAAAETPIRQIYTI